MELGKVIVISGRPGTGKTTLARHLRDELGLPLLSRDEFKESLFDTYGWSTREHSRDLGRKAYALLWSTGKTMTSTSQSFILESNFDPEISGPHLLELVAGDTARLLEIYCRCDDDVLLPRLRARNNSGTRHPGHLLHEWNVLPNHPPFNFSQTMVLDTTVLSNVNYAPFVDAVRAFTGKSRDDKDLE